MKSKLFVLVFSVLAIFVVGAAVAQSGSRPNGTSTPSAQPAGSASKPSGSHASAEVPKIIALQFYADWCPGCKALQPKLDEAMMNAADQPCLFVKLDMTEKDSHQSEYMIAALGYGNLWEENAGKTGFVLLVNTSTEEVVGTITSGQSIKEINATLNKALKS